MKAIQIERYGMASLRRFLRFRSALSQNLGRGKCAFVSWPVPSTHRCKPDLPNVLVWEGIADEILVKEATALVKRHSMPANLNAWILRGVGKDDWIMDPADRADGVPNANEVYTALP
jgi:hypothetical protein